MAGDAKSCYDDLADHYHLIFENWDASIARQAEALRLIVERECGPAGTLRVLDCACGIGTQALGLAKLGFRVTASDCSPRVVARVRAEALQRGLDVHSHVADIRDLSVVPEADFDVVICMDNALPHLENTEEVVRALREMRKKLWPGGLLMASIRDYDHLIQEKPVVQGPAFYSDEGQRRIVFQVWDWLDDRRYVFHLYITRETATDWSTVHAAAAYRSLTRHELTTALTDACFKNVRWLSSAESGFYQPIVLAEC
jgi:glycine/sarcosine N-methyltransferase